MRSLTSPLAAASFLSLLTLPLLSLSSCQAGTGGFASADGGEGGIIDPSLDGGGDLDGAATDAPVDAAPLPSASSTHYVACLTQLAFGNVDRVFSFYAETKFDAAPGGAAGGTLSVTMTALRTDPNGGNGVPPAKISATGKVGPPSSFAGAVGPTGAFTGSVGTVSIEAEANPITGRPVAIEQAKLDGFYAPKKFCAKLAGNVTVPVSLTLEPDKNVCLFFEITDGAMRPPFAPADFASCPL